MKTINNFIHMLMIIIFLFLVACGIYGVYLSKIEPMITTTQEIEKSIQTFNVYLLNQKELSVAIAASRPYTETEWAKIKWHSRSVAAEFTDFMNPNYKSLIERRIVNGLHVRGYRIYGVSIYDKGETQ